MTELFVGGLILLFVFWLLWGVYNIGYARGRIKGAEAIKEICIEEIKDFKKQVLGLYD